MPLFDYEIQATSGHARAGRYETAHGAFVTPMFMPVGTHATVKGITPDQLHEINSQVVLANTTCTCAQVPMSSSRQVAWRSS